MRIPKVDRLPSGGYRIRYRKNGLHASITRRTEAECIAEWMAIDSAQKVPDMPKSELTLAAAMDNYIDKYSGILADSTIRGYASIRRNRFQGLMPMKLAYITRDRWEQEIKFEARDVSAKTVKNGWEFVTVVMTENQIQIPKVKLPKVVKHEHEFLDPDEIPIFLEHVRGKPVELAALFGLHSMRRSEILALKPSNIDLKKSVIHVRGACTFNKENQLVYSALNKTDAGRRDIPIMIPRLTELLENVPRTDDLLVSCHPNTIRERVNSACEAAGLPKIGTHGLRHTFASLCCDLGIPEEATMKWGGWRDFQTVHNIYTHVKDRQQQRHAEKIRQFYGGHGIDHDKKETD